MAEEENKSYKIVNGERIELTPEELEIMRVEQEEMAIANFPNEKEERIRLLKTNCSNYIYSKYPIYKQLNIANGITEGREEMETFIQEARAICSVKEYDLKNANNRAELNNVDINFRD